MQIEGEACEGRASWGWVGQEVTKQGWARGNKAGQSGLRMVGLSSKVQGWLVVAVWKRNTCERNGDKAGQVWMCKRLAGRQGSDGKGEEEQRQATRSKPTCGRVGDGRNLYIRKG